jgi:hypothetical protein
MRQLTWFCNYIMDPILCAILLAGLWVFKHIQAGIRVGLNGIRSGFGVPSRLDRMAGKWLDWRLDRECRSSPQIQELRLLNAYIEPGRYNLMMSGPDIVHLADQAASMLEQQNAKNYIQFDMTPRVDRGLKPVRVTVQWAMGEAPGSKAARLEVELKKTREELALWQDVVKAADGILAIVIPRLNSWWSPEIGAAYVEAEKRNVDARIALAQWQSSNGA